MRCAIASIALVLTAVAYEARGELYQFQIAGTITVSDNPAIDTGDQFTGWFAYASDMVSDGGDSHHEYYKQNPAGALGVGITVNGTSYTTRPDTWVVLQVFDNFADWGYPAFDGFFLGGVLPSGYTLDMSLEDTTMTTFSSAAIPPPICLTLDNFDYVRSISFHGKEQQTTWYVAGAITSMTSIPEPSGLAMLGAGGVGLLCYGWRRRHTSPKRKRGPCRAAPLLVTAALLLAVLAGQASAESIVNGGFESGTFDGWQPDSFGSGNYSCYYEVRYTDEYPASEGDWYAKLLCNAFGSDGGDVSEAHCNLTSAPFSASAGDVLLFDSRAWLPTPVPPSTLSVRAFVSLAGGGDIEFTPIVNGGWTTNSLTLPASGNYSLNFQTSATAESTGVSIRLDLDNVHLTPVPEPSTLLLSVAALIGLLAYALRLRRRAR